MRWTSEQDGYLREHEGESLDALRRGIHRQFGVIVSQGAIRERKRRLGLPTVVYETCPECGRKVKALNQASGLCRECNAKALYERQLELNERLRKEIEENESVRTYERAYNAMRRRNERLR